MHDDVADRGRHGKLVLISDAAKFNVDNQPGTIAGFQVLDPSNKTVVQTLSITPDLAMFLVELGKSAELSLFVLRGRIRPTVTKEWTFSRGSAALMS